MDQYMKGYRQGFADGYASGKGINIIKNKGEYSEEFVDVVTSSRAKAKRKHKQTPKQKLLTKMTKAKWNKYKKGKGKKTYVEIRAEVSRSQLYKRKSKRLPSKYPRA